MAEIEHKIDRKNRRPVMIAGPVYTDFSRNCDVLKKDRQQVVTRLVDGWNRRSARRVKHQLEKQAAAICPHN